MTQPPCKLPDGWRWVRLGEVYLPTERRDPTKDPSTAFIYVDISPVDNAEGKIVSPREILGQDAPSRARKIIRSDDVILATTRPYLKNVAIVGPELDGQICSTGFFVLRANRRIVEPCFLFYLCRSDLVVAQLSDKNTRGASYPAVTDRDVYESLIPLPPLADQRRIVARIEELLSRVREARRLREEARQETELLCQSTLAETFPRPGAELPHGWRWVRLGEVFEVQQGASMSARRRLGHNPKPFLRTRNFFWGAIDTALVDEMDFTDQEIEKLRLQPGDLLVCEGGDVIWEGQLPMALYQNHVHRLRAKNDSIEPRFTMYWMQAAYQVFLAYQGSESRTAIPNLSGSRLKEFLIPLPPLEEQRRIVAHLEAVQEKIRALKASQSKTDEDLKRLEQAILDKAFRGEL
ncbi:MAG: restriction endonuclease subunit S [Desulfosoma sp.]